jgi:hypothetical protein
MQPSTEQLFELADEAKRAFAREEGCDGESDEEDVASLLETTGRPVRRGKATFHALPDGDVHVCFGADCHCAVVTPANEIVCHITGEVVGVHHTFEHNASWTGRSVSSRDPDQTAGTPIGGWAKKRCMFAASASAYKYAHAVSDGDAAPPLPPSQPRLRACPGGAGSKRVALCVDDPSRDRVARAKAQRRVNLGVQTFQKLQHEASGVIDKLMLLESASAPPTPPVVLDPRLQSVEFVTQLALRKFVNLCAAGAEDFNMDTLQNVTIHVNRFVGEQRALASAQMRAASAAALAPTPTTTTDATAVVRTGLSGHTNSQLARLAATLWQAACSTPYWSATKKSHDSFRPFVAGVLYSLKRGIYLRSGECIVPVCSTLARRLPALRGPATTPTTKQMQSSSHRGICALQRALASMSDAKECALAHQLFQNAATQAAFLRELVE